MKIVRATKPPTYRRRSCSRRIRTATIFYGPPPSRFGPVTGVVSPFLEDVRIPRAPRMTLSQAVARPHRAGHRNPFLNVTLRNPLGPKRSDPLCIFGLANHTFVGVDTVTRRVAPLS